MNKIDYTKIDNPVHVDSHTITGTVNGQPVRVQRRLANWTPRICVTLNGFTIWDTEPTEMDKEEFLQLAWRASEDHDKARQATIALAEQAGLIA